MYNLPNETIALLSSFRSSANRIQTVEALQHITMDSASYDHRVGQLLEYELIEVSDYSPAFAVENVLVPGSPSAFRLTVKGEDYLAMLDQQRKQRAKERRQKKNDEARAEKQNIENRRYDRQTAIISAIIGAIFGSACTLIVEHHHKIFIWVQSLFSR